MIRWRLDEFAEEDLRIILETANPFSSKNFARYDPSYLVIPVMRALFINTPNEQSTSLLP